MKSPKKYPYHIRVIGCHDCTEFDILLTRSETGLVGILTGLCNINSEIDCQPKMEMKLIGRTKLDSEYRRKLLGLQGRLTCIQSELSSLIAEESETDFRPHKFLPWDPQSSIFCSVCGHTEGDYCHRVNTTKIDYLPHDYIQGKGAVCRICGELKGNTVHTDVTIKDPESQWIDITPTCDLAMRESSYPPEGRTYGVLYYKGEKIAHLISDPSKYPLPVSRKPKSEVHLFLALVDKENYRIVVNNRCWAIQRKVD